MLNKKDSNGKIKINWDAIAVIIVVVSVIIGGIVGYADLQGQTKSNTGSISEIIVNTTKKTEGTLKNDVVNNNKEIEANKSEIKVLATKMDAMVKAQEDLRKEVRQSNGELKEMMNIIIQKLD